MISLGFRNPWGNISLAGSPAGMHQTGSMGSSESAIAGIAGGADGEIYLVRLPYT